MTRLATWLATCFGIGWIPIAPGTFASAAALPFGWALAMAGWPAVAAGAVAATAIGIWASDKHARKVQVYDPSECVIDEVAGQWFALVPIPLMAHADHWRPYLAAFLLFRLFDIFKPWPISAGERLPGGLGVMMDDVLAGIAAAILVYGMLVLRWI
jgi:phosphatidylglycerophosphatase A